jgi:hypothetical protein
MGTLWDKALKVVVNLSKYLGSQGIENKLRIQKNGVPERLDITIKTGNI